MASKSDYLEAAILNHILRGDTFAKPNAGSGVYIALCTAAPTDADTGSTITEPAGGSYARKLVAQADGSWDAPTVAGDTENTGAITFVTATASWGTITHVAICDALTDGNMLYHGALDASKAVGNGDTFSFAAGALDITEA
jgi:hypothetical protein